jgi:murein DD-endopeptidase MepM/ murein hydrolase activator NlpD
MSPKPSARWTVLVLAENGRAARTVCVPGWTAIAVFSWALCALWMAGFLGWQLQARFGLRGPRAIELAGQSDHAEHWGRYERLAPAVQGSTPAERRRYVAMLRAFQLGLGTREAASALWSGRPEPEWVQEAANGPASNGTLQWPVRAGMFGRGFGSGAGGYHLALDIDGPRGSQVLAAAPGIVGYASNGLRGYGTLVLLLHPGGAVTLYAHNSRVLVVPGEHVRAGQPIAELGSTGHSMGPHVHFELIQDGRNCDPLPLFRPTVPSVPGYLGPVREALWLPDQARPSAVRCARRQDRPRPHHDQDDPKAPVDEDGAEPLLSLTHAESPLALATTHAP